MSVKKILYAEDEVSNRKLIQMKLEKAGYVCDVVEDGEQAIVQFKQDNYSLVILDHYMPGMNGDQVASELLKIDPNVRMIAITSDDETITMLKRAGFLDVIIKPVHGNEALDKIISLIEED